MHPTVQEIAEALHAPEMLSASIIDTGQNNRVLDAGQLIVRVPRHDEARRDLVREAAILAVLAPRLPLPVPAPELRTVGTHVVAVHRKLPGQPLLSLDGLDGARMHDIAGSLARFLRVLHAIPPEVLPVVASNDPMAEWRELRDQVVAKVLPLLPADIGSSIRGRFARFLGDALITPRTIIHGDFGTGNILVEDGKVSGVIDFAGCGVSDPAYDLAVITHPPCDVVHSLTPWGYGTH